MSTDPIYPEWSDSDPVQKDRGPQSCSAAIKWPPKGKKPYVKKGAGAGTDSFGPTTSVREEYARLAVWSQNSVGEFGLFWTDPDPT